jgi:hypothetical protein
MDLLFFLVQHNGYRGSRSTFTGEENDVWYFGFGVLHGVWVKLVDDVSETTVSPIFTGQESGA